jgi:hypothetical protein
MKARQAVGPLIGLLKDGEGDVSFEAYQSLVRITGKEFGSPEAWRAWHETQGK